MEKTVMWHKQIDNIYQGKPAKCPACGSVHVAYDFFRFSGDVGCGDLHCNACGDGIHISRMKFPENTKIQINEIN